jgi:peptidoglycan/LPS O-acetylase OafA/YrhL
MTVVPPYLAFTTLYLIYSYFALGETSLYRAAWSYLLFDAVGIFWFLAVIIQLYLLFPYLATWMGLLEMRGQAWKAPVYSAVVYGVWWAFLEEWTANALSALWQPVDGFGQIVAERLFPGFLLFFVLGMYIARGVPRWRTRMATLSSSYMVAPLLLGAGMLTLLGSGFWWEIAVVPYSVVAAALLLRLSRWLAARTGAISSGLETIGRYSFGIYIAHILVMAAVVNRLWAVGLGAGDVTFYLLLYALTVGGCMLGLWALNLLPFGHLITGVKKEKKERVSPPEIRRVL